MQTIQNKVNEQSSNRSIESIAVSRTAYRLTNKMHQDHQEAASQLSDGHMYDLSTNIFDRLPQIFFDKKPDETNEYVLVHGRTNNNRVTKYIKREYINDVINFDYYKIILPKAMGRRNSFGQPFIGLPKTANTETFLSIGKFTSEKEAQNALKYIKTKFARLLLSILKVTQDVTPEKWKYVPLQDFTDNSDIDWSKSIPEIDQQLYKKYNLSEDEIKFIEEKVAPME